MSTTISPPCTTADREKSGGVANHEQSTNVRGISALSGTGYRNNETQGGEKYLGVGLSDKNGVPICEGDIVLWLGDRCKIRRVTWRGGLDGPVSRLQINEATWLTPFTAEMCEVVK